MHENPNIPPARASDPSDGCDPRLEIWRRLSGAFRRAGSQAPMRDESAPYGFATRIVADWLAKRRDQALLHWQRWSFRAAALSVFVALVVVLADRPRTRLNADDAPLIPFPGLEVPLPIDNPSSSDS